MKKETITQSTAKYAKAAAWLVETVARALAGYLILVNLDGLVTAVVAIYFLVSAGILFAAHFFKAYK